MTTTDKTHTKDSFLGYHFPTSTYSHFFLSFPKEDHQLGTRLPTGEPGHCILYSNDSNNMEI